MIVEKQFSLARQAIDNGFKRAKSDGKDIDWKFVVMEGSDEPKGRKYYIAYLITRNHLDLGIIILIISNFFEPEKLKPVCEMILANNPSLVINTIRTPGSNYYKLTEAIKRTLRNPAMPTIDLSYGMCMHYIYVIQ